MSVESIVRGFIEEVRSGKHPERAGHYLAERVKAHQVISGESEVLERGPANYQQHVQEFLRDYGAYQLTIEELLVQGDKAYVRWQQCGKHLGTIMGYPATGQTLITVGSAVYRVSGDKISEYWIQQENVGLIAQLKRHAAG